MRRLILVALLLCALPVGAQDFIRYYPPAGAAGLTSSGTAITSTLPLLLPDGSAGNPSWQWASDADGTGTGAYRYAAGNIMFVFNGIDYYRLQGGQFTIHATSTMAWGSSGIASADTFFGRDSVASFQLGQDGATAIAQTFKGADSTGATITGGSLTLKGGAGTSGIANGGALILAGGANSSTGEPGAVAIADGGTKPTCAAGIRGSIWYDAGGAGVADTFEVCAKQAAGDSYAWRVLATIP